MHCSWAVNTGVIGRPLQVTYGSPCVWDSCLVPSVTLVYCGQTVGWIKMPLGTEVGPGQGEIVLDGEPISSTQKGEQQVPLFGPYLLWPNRKRSPISATCFVLSLSRLVGRDGASMARPYRSTWAHQTITNYSQLASSLVPKTDKDSVVAELWPSVGYCFSVIRVMLLVRYDDTVINAARE